MNQSPGSNQMLGFGNSSSLQKTTVLCPVSPSPPSLSCDISFIIAEICFHPNNPPGCCFQARWFLFCHQELKLEYSSCLSALSSPLVRGREEDMASGLMPPGLMPPGPGSPSLLPRYFSGKTKHHTAETMSLDQKVSSPGPLTLSYSSQSF